MKIKVYENQDFNSKDKLFKHIANDLEEQGLVKDTFYKAIVDREDKYPTGLRGKIRNIAIPHADPINVNESAYIVILNKKPIKFVEMASQDSVIDVNLIIFILSSTPSGHMELLKKTLSLTSIDKEMNKETITSILTT